MFTQLSLLVCSWWNKGVHYAWWNDEKQWEAGGPDRESKARDQNPYREMQHCRFVLNQQCYHNTLPQNILCNSACMSIMYILGQDVGAVVDSKNRRWQQFWRFNPGKLFYLYIHRVA